MDRKQWIMLGALGIGLIIVIWLMTRGKSSSGLGTNLVVPAYNVGAGPTSQPVQWPLSEQPNIVGDHPNSQVPNGTNPQPPAHDDGSLPPPPWQIWGGSGPTWAPGDNFMPPIERIPGAATPDWSRPQPLQPGQVSAWV